MNVNKSKLLDEKNTVKGEQLEKYFLGLINEKLLDLNLVSQTVLT